jgi:hypothetical protein
MPVHLESKHDGAPCCRANEPCEQIRPVQFSS